MPSDCRGGEGLYHVKGWWISESVMATASSRAVTGSCGALPESLLSAKLAALKISMPLAHLWSIFLGSALSHVLIIILPKITIRHVDIHMSMCLMLPLRTGAFRWAQKAMLRHTPGTMHQLLPAQKHFATRQMMRISILRDVSTCPGWLVLCGPAWAGGLDQMISKVPFQPQLHVVPRRAELCGAKLPTAPPLRHRTPQNHTTLGILALFQSVWASRQLLALVLHPLSCTALVGAAFPHHSRCLTLLLRCVSHCSAAAAFPWNT